jgi:hypothetical protein
MMLILKNRHGFFDDNNNKYIGYVYEEVNSGRIFSISNKINTNTYYINEIDESFKPDDNTYSILTAKSLNESKDIIKEILEGKR